MKPTKKYFLLFILIINMVNASAQKIVKVGAFNFYPAIFEDEDGKVKGFYVDALAEIEKEEHIKFVYLYGSWNEGLERIKNGEIDIMTSVAFTDERATFMDYTQTPLLTVWGEVYLLPSSPIDGILNLEGKKIAVMKSDINGMHLKELTKKLSIDCQYSEAGDFEEVFQLIASGQVDAGVVNNTFGASKYDEFGLRSSGIVFNPFDIYFTVKKGKNAEILSLLNKYLKKWKYDRNSVYNISRQKWSHEKIGAIEIIPEWLNRIIYLSIILLIISTTFIALLRFQVKKAVGRVKKSESRFKAFMDNTPAYVYIKNKNLNHTYRNKMVDKLTGKIEDDAITSAKTIFDPAIAKLIEDTDNRILNFEARELNIIYSCKIDGKKAWLHDYKFLLEIPNEEIAIGGIAIDITSLKETQEKLNNAKLKAEESDKLKTAFLQNMSHEIRTPLNAIIGFSGVLDKPGIPKEKKKSFISIIKNSSNQLLSIVSDILTISSLETKQEKLNLNSVFINTIIDDLFSIYKEQAIKKDISLIAEKNLSDEDSLIKSDKTKITQILSNLITNALKFTLKGTIKFGYRLINDEIEFYVNDSGVGIPAEQHKKIFYRFHQVESLREINHDGTGLGLSISKGFTELLGGKIWLQSEPGKGSNFYFTIPYQPINDIKKPATNLKPNNTLATVLVAEDIESNYVLIKELLSRQSLKLIHVSNGKEAVEICKTNKQIDLILMDIKMPVMDGYTAAKLIKEDNPSLPIIAQTAYVLDHEYKNYNEPAFDDFITKPIDETTLIEKVLKYIDPKKTRNN
ncbi:MAG: ATP-binding protein [Bacteroidales bacterium]|nr:ATP-binding protein [Bacteroidales bacterium]